MTILLYKKSYLALSYTMQNILEGIDVCKEMKKQLGIFNEGEEGNFFKLRSKHDIGKNRYWMNHQEAFNRFGYYCALQGVMEEGVKLKNDINEIRQRLLAVGDNKEKMS
jgi:hypothetical protein